MITGLGIDLVEVARIENSLKRFGDRFTDRILLPQERFYCLGHKNPAPFVAARFAAKEAASKAFGTGIGPRLSWHDLEVARKPTGEPFFILHGGALSLMVERGAQRILLSISHTGGHAVAVVILEG